MLDVLFFARYKEALGQEQLRLDWQDDWTTLDDVRQHLIAHGEPWDILQDKSIMCARNQDLCSLTTPVEQGDEVAFFPTVTGG